MKSQEVNFLSSLAGNSKQTKAVWRLRNPPLNLSEYILNILNRLPPWSSFGDQFLRFSKNYLS